MDQHIKDLKQEVNEQVSKIIGIENILELTQKERDHSEELLMDKLEVILSSTQSHCAQLSGLCVTPVGASFSLSDAESTAGGGEKSSHGVGEIPAKEIWGWWNTDCLNLLDVSLFPFRFVCPWTNPYDATAMSLWSNFKTRILPENSATLSTHHSLLHKSFVFHQQFKATGGVWVCRSFTAIDPLSIISQCIWCISCIFYKLQSKHCLVRPHLYVCTSALHVNLVGPGATWLANVGLAYFLVPCWWSCVVFVEWRISGGNNRF